MTYGGKELIVLMGPPGSGKSTYAQRYLVKVTTDALREGHNMDEVYQDAYRKVNVALHHGGSVVFDSMGTAPTRAHLLRIARWQKAKARLVVFTTPLQVCITRQRVRLHPVPDDAVAKWHGLLREQQQDIKAEGWAAIEWVTT